MNDCWKRIVRALTKSKSRIWYASIIAWDDENRSWRVIGVIANNLLGNARIKINNNDRLVRKTPAYQGLEETYNNQFQEGEVTFYRRDADEMSSHIERIKTNDPRFLQKYDEELESEGKHIRLFRYRKRAGADLAECIDSLLLEALKAGYSDGET